MKQLNQNCMSTQTNVASDVDIANAKLMCWQMGAPLKVDESAGYPRRDFKCYGGGKELWDSIHPQVVIHGPAETGKTITLLHLLDSLCWNNPKLKAAIVRKTYADMSSTVIQTFENKVINMVSGRTIEGITKYGGEKPQFYDYPNGSRIWIVGLDRPGKVLSGELDVVVVNQAEELDKEDWETLSTRTTGRAGALKTGRLLGDANPGPSTHWIQELAAAGTLRMIKSRHRDNPTLYDPITGEITERGRISIAALMALTGVRRKRLYEGLWVAAEGIVYDTYQADTHIIDKPFSRILYHIAGVDWGFKNPGVIQVWGVDFDDVMYRVFELYYTKKFVTASEPEDAWWIQQALRIKERFGVKVFACDPSRPENIEAFQAAGLCAIKAFNPKSLGIQNMQSRLAINEETKRARMYLLRRSNGPKDPLLVKAHKATCFEDELELYSWRKTPAGDTMKEDPEDKDNHAADAARYAAAEVDHLNIEASRTETARPAVAGTRKTSSFKMVA